MDSDKTVTMTHEELAGFAFQVAGATSVPFMRDHPHYIIPSDEIFPAVARLLAEHGVGISGYARSGLAT